MASEVVALLRNLMQVNSAWSTTVRDALIDGLGDLSSLVQRLSDTYETDETDWCTMAQQVLATLCTLGGFKETVRPGCIAVVRNSFFMLVCCDRSICEVIFRAHLI